jgi:exonuclease III
MKKAKLDILAITETKKKGQGITNLNGNILLYSGVPMTDRAKAGVGCIVSERQRSRIKGWKFISERIMVLDLKENRNIVNLVIVYGPNDDERVEVKEEYYELLQKTLDDCPHEVILLGDFNARVGNDYRRWGGVIGRYGEEAINDNGKRLLRFSAE